MDNKSKSNSNIFLNLTRQSISRTPHATTATTIVSTTLSPTTFTTAGTVHHLAHATSRTESQRPRPRYPSDVGKSPQSLTLPRSLSTDDNIFSSPPLKRARLDECVTAYSEHDYSRMYVAEKEHLMQEAARMYQEAITELYYLESEKDILDFSGWNRRPNPQLACYIQARKLEDLMCIEGVQESQNDEIKVFVSSPGSQPIVTPIAISKTLPPAVTALQKNDPNKAIKHSKSTFSGLSPISPNKALSFSFTSPIKLNLSPEISVKDSAVVRRAENISGSGDAPASRLLDHNWVRQDSSSNKKEAEMKPTNRNLSDLRPANRKDADVLSASSNQEQIVNGDMSSQDAIIELAKHEAKVVQRVAELRRHGMWSQRRLPKVEESARRLSHWDLLLEEMRWMAVDFYQERRWKMAAACKMAKNSAKFCEEKNERGWRPVGTTYQKCGAHKIANLINEFWKESYVNLLMSKQTAVENENLSFINHIYQTELFVDKSALDRSSDKIILDSLDDYEISEAEDYLEEVSQLLTEGDF